MVTNRFLKALFFGLVFLLLGEKGIPYLLAYDGLLILLVAGDYTAGRFGGKIELERIAPPRLYQNQWTEIQINVKNLAPWVQRIEVRDDIPAAFDRKMERWHIKVKPYEGSYKSYQVKAAKRGTFAFGAIHWRAEGPLGLAFIQRKTVASLQIGVYPEIDGVHRLDMALRSRRWMELGFHRTQIKGAGSDLRELREYIPGDDIRKVDWKATARRAHPIVREYEPERGQCLHILLDVGRLMENRIGNRSRLDYAVSAALALAYAGFQQGDRVGVLAFADEVLMRVPPAKGRHHLPQIIEALYNLHAVASESDYDTAFKTLLTGQQKQGVVCLFTELVDELASERLLNRMSFLARHHRPICVTIKDPVLDEFFEKPLDATPQLYAQGVALQIARERERARSALARRGVVVVDAAPEDLSIQLIGKYLDLKNGSI